MLCLAGISVMYFRTDFHHAQPNGIRVGFGLPNALTRHGAGHSRLLRKRWLLLHQDTKAGRE